MYWFVLRAFVIMCEFILKTRLSGENWSLPKLPRRHFLDCDRVSLTVSYSDIIRLWLLDKSKCNQWHIYFYSIWLSILENMFSSAGWCCGRGSFRLKIDLSFFHWKHITTSITYIFYDSGTTVTSCAFYSPQNPTRSHSRMYWCLNIVEIRSLCWIADCFGKRDVALMYKEKVSCISKYLVWF